MKDNLKWTKSKIFLIVFNCALCVAVLVSSMVIVIDKSRTKNGVIYEPDEDETTVAETSNQSESATASARLMFAGDNLIHKSVYAQANVRNNGDGYDFSYAYENLKPILKNADIAFLSQESIIDSENNISSYPTFNSPAEILSTISNVGFNVINQATNHLFDMGQSGVKNDIATVNNSKITMTGLYSDEDAMMTPIIKEVQGIKFSFIGITENINEQEALADTDTAVICLNDTRYSSDVIYSKIQKMVENAKANSDVVCVAVHWSDDNNTTVSENQKNVVNKILGYGADIIIGSGPHTLQPIEYMKNGDGEQALVMYSLGNLITCQSNVDNLLGGIADVTVTKTNGTVQIKSVKFIPTITHYEDEFGNVRIIPLSSYSEDLAEVHGIHSENDDEFTMEYINNFYQTMYKDILEVNV